MGLIDRLQSGETPSYGRRPLPRDERAERIRSARDADDGLGALQYMVADEMMERLGAQAKQPAVATTRGGHVTVYGRTGEPLVKVQPNEKVRVTTRRSDVIIEDTGDVDAVVESETDVTVRQNHVSTPLYSMSRFRDRGERIAVRGTVIESDEGRNLAFARPHYAFTEDSNELIRMNVDETVEGLIVNKPWMVILQKGRAPRTVRMDEALVIEGNVPQKAYPSGIRTVLKQPLDDEPLQLGDLVEVLENRYWDDDKGRYRNKVVRISTQAPDWDGNRRYFFDPVDMAPWEPGVLRLGDVRGAFGTTKAQRPAEPEPAPEPETEPLDAVEILGDLEGEPEGTELEAPALPEPMDWKQEDIINDDEDPDQVDLVYADDDDIFGPVVEENDDNKENHDGS